MPLKGSLRGSLRGRVFRGFQRFLEVFRAFPRFSEVFQSPSQRVPGPVATNRVAP